MRLFYAAASPYARIVRVALLETGLDAQVGKQEVTLRDPNSALLPYNPVGRVPTLELDDGTILTESLLILNYLDTRHAGRPLLPRDGSDRWRTLAEMGTASMRLSTWSGRSKPQGSTGRLMSLSAQSRRVVTQARSMQPASCLVAPWVGSIRVILSGSGAPAGRA